jgi:predicted dehydrogenase
VAHAGPAVAGLEAGCHVLVEKPMATSAADARAIAQAAERAGREVMVPTGLNFTPAAAQARDWVREGRIGTVRHLACQMGSPLDDLMAGKAMAETADHLFRPPPSTWADPKRAGGYGWGQLSHALAWVAWVTGEGWQSLGCLQGASPTGVDYYDAGMGRMTGGATMALSGSSTVPKHVGMHLDVRVYGTEGMVWFSNLPARLELRRHDGRDEALPMTDFEGLYDGSLPVKAFARLCAGEAVENASDAINGLRVTAALEALYRSAVSGRIEAVG